MLTTRSPSVAIQARDQIKSGRDLWRIQGTRTCGWTKKKESNEKRGGGGRGGDYERRNEAKPNLA